MGNIDRQHLRPPVLAVSLEIIETDIFDESDDSLITCPSNFQHYRVIHRELSQPASKFTNHNLGFMIYSICS